MTTIIHLLVALAVVVLLCLHTMWLNWKTARRDTINAAYLAALEANINCMVALKEENYLLMEKWQAEFEHRREHHARLCDQV